MEHNLRTDEENTWDVDGTKWGGRMRKREKERQRQTDRQTDRETERQREREKNFHGS